VTARGDVISEKMNNPKTYISAQQHSAETEKLSMASLTASKT